MKKLATILLTLTAITCSPAFAETGIEFNSETDNAGSWSYDGAGTLGFEQYATVDSAMGNNADSLVVSLKYVPTLSVNAYSGCTYSVKPVGNSIPAVRSVDDSTIYMKATLGQGNMAPIGTTGAAYTSFSGDLTDVYVTEPGKAPGSAVLSAIVNSNITTLDFELPLKGGRGTNY